MLPPDWKRHWCLVVYLGAHGQDYHSPPDLQPVCRSSRRFSLPFSGVYTDFQLFADGDIFLDLDI